MDLTTTNVNTVTVSTSRLLEALRSNREKHQVAVEAKRRSFTAKAPARLREIADAIEGGADLFALPYELGETFMALRDRLACPDEFMRVPLRQLKRDTGAIDFDEAPLDFTRSYDEAIAIVEAHTEATMVLDRSTFRQWVLDEWPWQNPPRLVGI